MAGLRVADAFDHSPLVITGETTATLFLLHPGAGNQDAFPVVDERQGLLGVLSVADLARIARGERERQHALTARAVAQFHRDPGPGRFPAGRLSRSDVLALYGRILAGAPDSVELGGSSSARSIGGLDSGSR